MKRCLLSSIPSRTSYGCPCHGKYGSAPCQGSQTPINRSLYIECFVPTNLQLTRASKHHSYFATVLDKLNAVIDRFSLSWASNEVGHYKKSALMRHLVVERVVTFNPAMESLLNDHRFNSSSFPPLSWILLNILLETLHESQLLMHEYIDGWDYEQNVVWYSLTLTLALENEDANCPAWCDDVVLGVKRASKDPWQGDDGICNECGGLKEKKHAPALSRGDILAKYGINGRLEPGVKAAEDVEDGHCDGESRL